MVHRASRRDGRRASGRARPHRQTLPLDPPGWSRRTLGGIAATAASGPLRLRYGAMRDLLLGVRFVQADGVSTWGGAKVVKSVTGYDVPKLLVGSLGTLGGHRARSRCGCTRYPRPRRRGCSCYAGPRPPRTWWRESSTRRCSPNRSSWLDAGALAAGGLPAAPAALADLVGSVAAAVRAQHAAIAEAAARGGHARRDGGTGVLARVRPRARRDGQHGPETRPR